MARNNWNDGKEVVDSLIYNTTCHTNVRMFETLKILFQGAFEIIDEKFHIHNIRMRDEKREEEM